MHILKLKYFYTFGILLILLNFSYAVDSVSRHNIPANISILIKNGKQKNAIVLINQTIEKKKTSLNKTKKTDILTYTSLYDEMAELIILKNELLLNLDKTDDIDTDKICNFILDYEEVEFIKTQYYKTPFHDDVAKTVQNIASLYALCYPPMAGKYLKSVLRIKENVYGKESVEAANAYDKLGDHHHFSMAEFKSAIEHYEKAKVIRENLYGATDPKCTVNYGQLAMSMFYFGDKENRAEELLYRSIGIREINLSQKDFPLYSAHMDLGIYYAMKDEHSKSIIHLKEALSALKGKLNSDYIVILSELSRSYLKLNNLHNALINAKEAHIKAKELYGERKHPQVVESFRQISVITEMIDRAKSK